MNRFSLEYSFGISPCPNDTFIMYGLNTGKVEMPFIIHTKFADVQELNAMVLNNALDISKISVAVYPLIEEEYEILSCGGAMGLSCGPMVVARKGFTIEELYAMPIAIPGENTTANALLNLYASFTGERKYMVFDEIIPALTSGTHNVGVLIHESRFEYERYGLEKVVDLGDFWEEHVSLPLPLGIIVARRRIPQEHKRALEASIRSSLSYAYAKYNEALEYCMLYAQEMQKNVLEQHIATFVNEYSMECGETGKKAIKTLLMSLQK